jgi:hypothetical protein
MTIREENRDLFTVPQGYYLAHCISGDFALGAGIAKQFVNIYNMKEKLSDQFPIEEDKKYDYVGEVLLVDNVFNLVTKPRCYHKPTYDTLRSTLEEMKGYILSLKITKLAIPQIGCGLDRLDWDAVKELIEEVFEDVDIEILVCIL